MGVILVVGTSLINHFVPKESISNPVMIDNSKNTPIIEQQLIVNQPTELKVYQYPLTLPKKPVKPMVTATPVFIPTVTPTIKPPTVTPKPFNLIPDDLDYNRFPKSGTDVHGNIEIGDCVSLAPNVNWEYTNLGRDYYFAGDTTTLRTKLVNVGNDDINKVTYYLTVKNLDTGFIIKNNEKIYERAPR
jgi:hypothetical protein